MMGPKRSIMITDHLMRTSANVIELTLIAISYTLAKQEDDEVTESLYLGSLESCKTLEQKFIFQIGTCNPHGINKCFPFN